MLRDSLLIYALMDPYVAAAVSTTINFESRDCSRRCDFYSNDRNDFASHESESTSSRFLLFAGKPRWRTDLSAETQKGTTLGLSFIVQPRRRATSLSKLLGASDAASVMST